MYPLKHCSPDECLWCGGKYEDHVKLSWAKKNYLYTPFDLHLDSVAKRAKKSKAEQVWKTVPPDVRTIYKFHERYVLNIDSVIGASKRKSEQKRILKEKFKQQYGSDKTMKTHKIFGIRYALPGPPDPGLLRYIVLTQFNRLIQIQEYENEALDLKRRGHFTHGQSRRLKAKFGLI